MSALKQRDEEQNPQIAENRIHLISLRVVLRLLVLLLRGLLVLGLLVLLLRGLLVLGLLVLLLGRLLVLGLLVLLLGRLLVLLLWGLLILLRGLLVLRLCLLCRLYYSGIACLPASWAESGAFFKLGSATIAYCHFLHLPFLTRFCTGGALTMLRCADIIESAFYSINIDENPAHVNNIR